MKLEHIIKYLVDSLINASIYEAGDKDEKINKKSEAIICDMFERYVTGCDGDNIPEFFKIDESGVVYGFNGRYFEPINDGGLKAAIKEAMKRLKIGLVYQKNSYEKIAKECVLSLDTNDKCAFNPDRRYMVFNNCILDLQTNKTIDHNIDILTDLVLDFDYDPDAHLPRWDSFLDQVLPNLEVRGVLQEFCGAMLVDRKKFKIENICYLVGNGLNGKSVFMDAIKSCFGLDVVSAFSPEALFKSNTAMYNIAVANGKIANICDDVSNKDISGGEFKAWVSGAPFQARNPYGKPFMAKNIPLMMCGVNAVPTTTDDTKGHHRRPLPIIFDVTISEKDIDTTLLDQFSTPIARSYILNWILVGRRRFIDNTGKFTKSEAVRKAQEDLKMDSNSARRWIRDMGYFPIEVDSKYDSHFRPMKAIYDEYIQYCKDNGDNSPKSMKGLATIMNSEGYAEHRRGDGMYRALGVNSDLTEEEREKAAIEDAAF